ncbi:MAG: nitroreductase family protein, partial [Planctomycetes bacterium]|nr:nitroreductase family protein [Planctomycetota bacterium]
MLEDPLECVLRYHEQTKHHPDRYARSLGYLDWATQPDPFRTFAGSRQIPLDHPALTAEPTYDALFRDGAVPACAVNRNSISRLFYDSLALSAWKQAPGAGRWSLRINPSSGALHPTEGYLIGGTIEGLSSQPAVYHYAAYSHALEQRVTLGDDEWSALAAELPAHAVLVALASIYWRESWKYGERAFRYCHHDVGHAIGAVAIAAATLGWETRMVTTVSDDALAALLGTNRQHGIEAEHPDCLLAVFPRGEPGVDCHARVQVPASLIERLAACEFTGRPNPLSRDHHPWPVIEEVSRAAHFLAGDALADEKGRRPCHSPALPIGLADRSLPALKIIRQRRSAIEMDGTTRIPHDVFYHMLARVTPAFASLFDVLPWKPQIALAIFVHRVDGVPPGMYVLARGEHQESSLRSTLHGDFLWRRPAGCPDELPLWCLAEADCQRAARVISCQQAIASDGVFSLGMLAEYESSLRHRGAWFYPRLFWETGLIGQVLY